VRVTANLIDAATAQNLWGRSFERDLTSVLSLQSDVAKAIAQNIEIALTPEEETRLSNRRSVNSKTYEAYLRGMHHLSKGTAEGFRAGIAHLNEAVDNDPADPLAYAGLALGYIRVGHDTGPSDLYFPRAIAAARRALELDPTSAMAYAALADAQMYYEWDWRAAGSAFEQAIALNPSLAEAHAHYSWFHAIFARWDRAIEHARRAKQLDPLSPLFTTWLGGIYYFAGQYEAALVEVREALDMAPGFGFGWFQLGITLSAQGDHDEAIEALRKAVELNPAWTSALAAAYARAGRVAEARELLTDLETQDAVDPFGISWVYLYLEDLDSMFLWLERALEARHRWVPWFPTWPGIEAAHGDPRFQELLERLDITFQPSVPPADAT
jgi:tetratricopeptide (TPR) repeat protein